MTQRWPERSQASEDRAYWEGFRDGVSHCSCTPLISAVTNQIDPEADDLAGSERHLYSVIPEPVSLFRVLDLAMGLTALILAVVIATQMTRPSSAWCLSLLFGTGLRLIFGAVRGV